MTWQDIGTAPKDGTEVLLWTDTRLLANADKFAAWGGEHFQEVQIGYWEDEVNAPLRKEAAGWRCRNLGVPTHWQPLPPPPEAER